MTELVNAKDCVGMTEYDPRVVPLLSLAFRPSCDDVPATVTQLYFGPKRFQVLRGLTMGKASGGSSGQTLESISWVSANRVFVTPVELSPGLLQERNPNVRSRS